jgi:hypothetical protein
VPPRRIDKPRRLRQKNTCDFRYLEFFQGSAAGRPGYACDRLLL